jgi:hypothetical protein
MYQLYSSLLNLLDSKLDYPLRNGAEVYENLNKVLKGWVQD